MGSFNIAQAACSYSIDFSERTGRTAVTSNDILQYSVRVSRSGPISDCVNSVQIILMVKVKNGGRTTIESKSSSFQPTVDNQGNVLGSLATANFGLDLNTFDRSQLPVANVVQAFVRVSGLRSDTTSTSNGATFQDSNVVSMQITGALGTSGQVKLNVYFFDPNNQSLTKGTFKAEETITVLAELNKNDVKNLSSDIKNIYAAFYVNDFAKPIYGTTILRSSLETDSKLGAKFTVGTQSNFKNGTNIAQVKLFEANTSGSLGEGRGSVQVQGLGQTPGQPQQPGGQPGGQPGQPGGQSEVDSKLNEFLFNPLPTDSLTGTLLTIAKGFLGIVALWAVVFIVIGGFKLTMAQGQEEAYLAAKKTIIWAILGLVVAMLSFSIIAIVQNLLQVKIPPPPGAGDEQTVRNKTN